MNVKRIKRVQMVVGVVGFSAFLFVVGTVGSNDLDKISLGACIWRSMVGLAIMGGCVKADAFIDTQIELAKKKEDMQENLDMQDKKLRKLHL